MFISQSRIEHLRRVQRLLDSLVPNETSCALLVPGSPKPRGTLIVFLGSFNPPTIAHLALLKEAQRYARQHSSMELYAAFSKRTVDKERVERPLLLDRVMLLQDVLRHHLPRAGMLLFNRGLYVEQAEAIRTSFPRVHRILFLMGYDKIVQILDPRYYEDRERALQDLFTRAELLVAPRGDDGEGELLKLLDQPQNRPYKNFILPLPLNSSYRTISSTAIRRTGGLTSSEVPEEVRRFARSTHAYEPPIQRMDGTLVDVYARHVSSLHRLLHMPIS